MIRWSLRWWANAWTCASARLTCKRCILMLQVCYDVLQMWFLCTRYTCMCYRCASPWGFVCFLHLFVFLLVFCISLSFCLFVALVCLFVPSVRCYLRKPEKMYDGSNAMQCLIQHKLTSAAYVYHNYCLMSKHTHVPRRRTVDVLVSYNWGSLTCILA